MVTATESQSVCVGIPWRATPSREAPHRRVRQFWEYAGFPIIEDPGDPDPEKPFNLAKARNNLVKAMDADIIIICDADVIPPLHAIQIAINDPRGVIYPATESRLIPHNWVERPDLAAAPADDTLDNYSGYIYVMRRELYWRLGGQDETFEGWGGEDTAFNAVAQTFSETRRIPGTLFAFNHQGDRKMSEPNSELLRRYAAAMGSQWRMRELLKDLGRI